MAVRFHPECCRDLDFIGNSFYQDLNGIGLPKAAAPAGGRRPVYTGSPAKETAIAKPPWYSGTASSSY